MLAVQAPVLWPPHVKSWLIGKDSDAGRDWGQEEKGTTEDEMAGWHHWLDGPESEWTPGVGDGQGGLACCDSWGCKELDTTEWLNWTELSSLKRFFQTLCETKHICGKAVPWKLPVHICAINFFFYFHIDSFFSAWHPIDSCFPGTRLGSFLISAYRSILYLLCS